MNYTTKKTNKKEHAPDCTCSICGSHDNGFNFKRGYVCESCLEYIKDSYNTEAAASERR